MSTKRPPHSSERKSLHALSLAQNKRVRHAMESNLCHVPRRSGVARDGFAGKQERERVSKQNVKSRAGAPRIEYSLFMGTKPVLFVAKVAVGDNMRFYGGVDVTNIRGKECKASRKG
uniref:Transposase n=1 Tax=Steinernema glaseri TaxID=37863 RepID=A0A1I7ZMZ3_9BILA